MYLIFVGHVAQAQQITVTSLPSLFFNVSSTSVVQGSVIWLYCVVNSASSALSVAWNKDGELLVQDVPHVRLRAFITSSSTTLLLVIDNVVSSDAGVYQCTAMDRLNYIGGDNFTMTGRYLFNLYDMTRSR